ncbi:L-rhamnose-binding lectin ELEL-1-like [Aethina tumida]|uniref:L-rhamnose-binding lectin ELEL-1-like n=1 Tax=Aethina tumida TaxID=116153 RepID=UPI00096B4DCC|nr:L-rhamnose-binding lectin ELEL-1-like [Aethina tumida]
MFYQPFLALFLMSYISVTTQTPTLISQEIVICEGKYNKIECPDRLRIRISSAFYGNAGYSVCGSKGNIECYNPKTLVNVHEMCEGKYECILMADNDSFGNKCPAGNNHLKVGFTCERF